MQVCKECGSPIKYISVNSDKYAIVDPEPIEVYTEMGHRHTAYKKHVCKPKPEKENAGE